MRPELDDSGWATVAVPGHWRDEALFARSDGPLLYRRRFQTEPLSAGERAWLVMEGIGYEADVWLDGSYLGDTEGYFFPHCFEVTQALSERREHLLAVEVACPRPLRQGSLLGAWADPSYVSSSYNPGGIWAHVWVVTSGPVRLARLRAACLKVRRDSAVLELAARLDAVEPGSAELTTTVTGPVASEPTTFAKPLHLAGGANSVRWQVVVQRPALWWPAGLGGQPLYEVAADVSVGGTGSDSRSLATGLREVRMKAMTWEVNGEKVFLQGADLAPTCRNLAAATPDEVARDVLAARDAGFNLLRVSQHVGRPELYRAADEAGVLLWQDLPAPGRWAGRSRAMRQAQELVWLLSHHPSLVAWVGGGDAGARRERHAAAPDGVVWLFRGSWLAKRALNKAVEQADGSRPVVSRVPAVAARLVAPGGPRSYGEAPRLGRLQRASAIWPAAARFVAAATPPSPGSWRPERWPELDLDALASDREAVTAGVLQRYPPASFANFDLWAEAVRAEQAEFVGSLVEQLRRLRFYPAGGFLLSRLNDAQESFGTSLLDHERRPKPAWGALRHALAPLLPAASGLGSSYRAGSKVAFRLWVLNASTEAVGDLELRARLTWPGGARVWRFAGDAPAKSTSLVGRRAALLPGSQDLVRTGGPPWQLRLELELVSRGRELGRNAYARPIGAEG